jgi:hypothetical protein
MPGALARSLERRAVRYLERVYECYVGYNGLKCLNRCRHCWAGGLPEQPYVDVDRLEPAMKVCREWLDEAGFTRVGLLFAVLKNGGLYEDWERYHELLMKYCDLPSGYARVLTLPGLQKLSSRELRALYKRAKAIGIEWISTTLHGADLVHDSFVGQKGYYAYYKDALRIAKDAGLQTNVLYFVSKRNIGCIAKVQRDFLDLVTHVRGLALISFRVMQPFGLARQEIASFLQKDDIEKIPPAVVHTWLLDLDTESNFVHRALDGEEISPVKDIAVFPDHDFICEPTPEQFGVILERFFAETFARPPLREMARRYGDRDSSLLLNPRGFLHLLEMRRGDGRSG